MLVPTSRVTNMTAPDGEAGTIRIVFFRRNFTHYHGVADLLSFAGWDVVIFNGKECVSACNPFGMGGGSRTYSLTKSSELIGVRSVPRCFVAGITAKLAMLKEFTNGGVKH